MFFFFFFFFLIRNKNIVLKEEKCHWSIQEVYIRDKVQVKSIKYKSPKTHEQKINHDKK